MWPNTKAKVQAKCHIKLHQSQRKGKEIPPNLQLKFVCQLKHEHGATEPRKKLARN